MATGTRQNAVELVTNAKVFADMKAVKNGKITPNKTPKLVISKSDAASQSVVAA